MAESRVFPRRLPPPPPPPRRHRRRPPGKPARAPGRWWRGLRRSFTETIRSRAAAPAGVACSMPEGSAVRTASRRRARSGGIAPFPSMHPFPVPGLVWILPDPPPVCSGGADRCPGETLAALAGRQRRRRFLAPLSSLGALLRAPSLHSDPCPGESPRSDADRASAAPRAP